jgi:proton glutamate symport protein
MSLPLLADFLAGPTGLAIRLLALGGAAFLAYKRKGITAWMFFALLAGIVVGMDAPAFALELKVVSQVFLKLVKSIIAPLLFATLAVGIAGHGNVKSVGRMGGKALLYFEVVTTFALAIGLLAINISKVGVGIPAITATEKLELAKPATWQEIILHIFPESIAKSVAEGQVLQVVLFSVLFGIGLAQLEGRHKQTMLSALDALAEVMFKYTGLVMYLAPLAVGASIAYTVAKVGLGILGNLAGLLLTLYGALFVFILFILVPIGLLTGLPFKRFWAAISEPVALAFATTSSEAALPKAMRAMEGLGVPRRVVAFVMPTGYSFNLDGTTLYLALASIFVAQAAGITLTWQVQVQMMITLMLTSKGVAGVPRASLVILAGTVASFGLPTEPIFIILGIDALMDMARTSVNVIGNCLACWVVAKWEGIDPNQELARQEQALTSYPSHTSTPA